jgi:hypothetical protein
MTTYYIFSVVNRFLKMIFILSENMEMIDFGEVNLMDEPIEEGLESCISEKTLIDRNEQYELYKVDLRHFITTIEDWNYNRKKDKNHINEIKSNYPAIYGDFVVVRCKYDNDKLLLIDGQHRRDAIMELYGADPALNGTGYVKVYNVNSINEIGLLFKKINNIMPVKITQIPQFVYIDVIEQLQTKFPQAIRNGERANYPYISKSHLLEILQKSNIVEEYGLTSIKLYDEIFKKNAEYGIRKDLLGKINIASYEKVQKTGFYLGLDRNAKWIGEIKINLPIIKKIKVSKKKN